MTFLDDLLASTQGRIARAREVARDLEARAARAPAPRSLTAALRGGGVSLIAEIKRASPLKGPLAPHLDPLALARAYSDGGAAAVSVLTEPSGFLGSLEDLEAARVVDLPVLRKDFVLDPVQVVETRAYGGDALLLIVRALEDDRLRSLLRLTEEAGMEALVEVHDEVELERALDAGARLVGVNHRNLDTFEVDPERTAKLSPLLPDGITLVALSGVATRAEVEALAAAGADAVLVGESLVTAPDPTAKLRELLGGA